MTRHFTGKVSRVGLGLIHLCHLWKFESMPIALRPGTYIVLILDKLQYNKHITFTVDLFNIAAALTNIANDLTCVLSRLL